MLKAVDSPPHPLPPDFLHFQKKVRQNKRKANYSWGLEEGRDDRGYTKMDSTKTSTSGFHPSSFSSPWGRLQHPGSLEGPPQNTLTPCVPRAVEVTKHCLLTDQWNVRLRFKKPRALHRSRKALVSTREHGRYLH